jgi:hypothetical protein
MSDGDWILIGGTAISGALFLSAAFSNKRPNPKVGVHKRVLVGAAVMFIAAFWANLGR